MLTIAGILLVSMLHGVVFPAEPPPPLRVEFSDEDPRGGWLSGDLSIADPDNSSRAVEYELQWGNNPRSPLGQYRPLAKLRRSAWEDFRMVVKFRKVRLPPGATHFLFNSLDADGARMERLSLPIVDLGVPAGKARGLFFRQERREGNRVRGEAVITRAWEERDITHYALYWGTGPDTVLRASPMVALARKNSWFGALGQALLAPWKTPRYRVLIDAMLPAEATHLHVFTRNAEGQMSEGLSFPLEQKERAPNHEADIVFHAQSAGPGMLAGEARITRAGDESGFSHYLLFWGRDAKTRLERLPTIAQFEVRPFQDGIEDKELKVETSGPMEQLLNIVPRAEQKNQLVYRFPDKTAVPEGASHLLVSTQQKYWFEDNTERRIGRVVASAPLKKDALLESAVSGTDGFESPASPDEKPKGGKTQPEQPSAAGWRSSEYRGLGLGITFSGLNSLALYYDYNPGRDTQWRMQLEHTGPTVGNLFKTLRLTEESSDMGSIAKSASGNTLEIGRTLGSLIWRRFVDPEWIWGLTGGLYIGAGLGFGYSTLNYSGRDSSADSEIGEGESFVSSVTNYRHDAEGRGVFFGFEAGWQGHENYMFHLSLQPAYYVMYEDGYDQSKVPQNPNQRSLTNERWERARNLNRILVGLGVFF